MVIKRSVAADSMALEALFRSLFYDQYQTLLVGGGDEPVYLPSDKQCKDNRIIYTQDYVASALHEVAHWCVAGIQRHRQVDYGYWYSPDGRTLDEQQLFEQVESKPQALEWIFANACGLKFRLSADNLAQGNGISDSFKSAVVHQAKSYCEQGVNQRCQQWIDGLSCLFDTHDVMDQSRYSSEYFDEPFSSASR